MTISRTTARARLEAAGFGSPSGLLYVMFNYGNSCDESVTCQEMKHITLAMNKRLPNPEQNTKECKHSDIQDRQTTKDVEEDFPGPVSGGGLMTFFPYFASLLATIGASRPDLGETPRRVKTSSMERECHSRSERSKQE